MATDLERLVVTLSADVRGYQRSLQRMIGETNKAAGSVESRFNRMNRSINTQMGRLRSIPVIGGGLAGGVAGLGAAFGARQVQQYADTWTESGNKIAAAGQVAGRAGRSLEGINDIAERSRTGFKETVSLYSRILQTTGNILKSEEEVARATEIISKSFAAGGANAAEAAASVLQLGQALGSGTLQGDELRSIRENAPLLARAIAKEFGVAIGELKELGSEGQLTSDRVIKAVLDGGAEIEAAFNKTNPTIANGFTQVENAFIQLIGTFDQGTGASANLTRQLLGLADVLDSIGENAGETIKQWNEFIESGSTLSNMLKVLGASGSNFADSLSRGENPFNKQFLLGGANTAKALQDQNALERGLARYAKGVTAISKYTGTVIANSWEPFLDVLNDGEVAARALFEQITGADFGAVEHYMEMQGLITEGQKEQLLKIKERTALEEQLLVLQKLSYAAGDPVYDRLVEQIAKIKEEIRLLEERNRLFGRDNFGRGDTPSSGRAAYTYPGALQKQDRIITSSGGGSEGRAADLAFGLKEGLLALVAKLESASNYNAINFKDVLGLSKSGFQVIGKSINEITAVQRKMLSAQYATGTPYGEGSSALGKYQVIRKTLRDTAASLGIDFTKALTEADWDQIGAAILAGTKGVPEEVRKQFEAIKKAGFTDEEISKMFAVDSKVLSKANEQLAETRQKVQEVLRTGQDRAKEQEYMNNLLGDESLAAEKLRKQYELINEARAKLGRELLPAEREQIIANADRLAEAEFQQKSATDAQLQASQAMEDQLNRQAEAAQKVSDTMNQIGQAFGGALQGFVSDLIQGKKLTDALRDALVNLGQQIFQIALNNLFSGSTGGGGGFLSSLFGGGGGGAGGILGGLFHKGGEIGKSGGLSLRDASAYSGAKRYHSGRLPGLRSDEMAGIFKKNEIIFPDWKSVGNAARKISGGRGSAGLTQYNTFVAPDWKTSLRSQNQLARSAGSELARINRTM